jgi:hypothetical protein
MLRVLISAYLAVGLLHVLWFELSVTQTDCAMAGGLTGVYCDTPIGVSQLIVLLAWPMTYLR